VKREHLVLGWAGIVLVLAAIWLCFGWRGAAAIAAFGGGACCLGAAGGARD